MSDPADTIEPHQKKEDKMNENQLPNFDPITGVIGDYAPAESTHPVLAKLYEKIANLETELETTKTHREADKNRAWDYANNFANYKYKLENVLRTYAQDNSATAELFVEIANEMDIELVNTKDFEINVTFNVTVAAPFGEEIELSEYDVDATIDLSGIEFELNDTGVVYINED